MPHSPPENLIELLEALGLATRQDVEGVAWRVRRLAGELPLFESVWVDALCQGRLLTPFQAAEINAGRGKRLLVGPYLLCRSVPTNGLGQAYLARQRVSSAPHGRSVRLLRAQCEDQSPQRILDQFGELIHKVQGLEHVGLRLPFEAGIVGDDCWIVCEHVEGDCAADWLAHNGRFPPEAVLEIARQMAHALAALESHGVLHGDVGARQLTLTRAGEAILTLAGARTILRPAEGYTRLDLPPEGYDYLAPERISEGSAPDTASDVYACGCLWWHLLCGRPPLAGGDALGKVRSAQLAKIADVRRYSPNASEVLIATIEACTQVNPQQRPRSMSALAAQLGPPDRTGRAALVKCFQPAPVPAARPRSVRGTSTPASSNALLPVALASMLLIGLGFWWSGRGSTAMPLNEIRAPAPLKLAPENAAVSQRQSPATPPQDNRPSDLVLPAGPVRLNELRLLPGQTVRSAPGARALVLTPAQGLLLAVEDVRLVNLDFAPDGYVEASEPSLTVLIRLAVDSATLQGCSFQGVSGKPAVAIDWCGPQAATGPRSLLPTGRVRVADCVFHALARGIHLRAAGALRVELSQCLHTGPGPWMTLQRLPRADETCLINLNHCTLRGGRAVLESPASAVAGIGEIHVQTNDCVFAPIHPGGLLSFFGAQPGSELLGSVRISGQGSIVSPETALALWQPDYGAARAVGDEQIAVAGLVRSAIGFAGEHIELPAASRAVRWQAPLASADPPGIGDQPLYLPKLEDGR